MMENFVYYNPTKVIFGKGTENTVGKEVKIYGSRVLLHHYGDEWLQKSGLLDRIRESLKSEGLEIFELTGVKPNPRLKLVYEGIDIVKEKGIDFILAVGGGSVIDSSKAIAIGVPYEGDVWDFYTGEAEVKETLPVGVILTIAASGSETSASSVITNEEGWYKRSIDGCDIIRPKFAIMNPELTYTLPTYQTASGGADIMSHVMERFFSVTQYVDITDRLCEAVLKTVIKNLTIVLSEPDNYNARAEIMWAGSLAHNDLVGTGRKPAFACHWIEHEIGGIYDVAHGAGITAVTPSWMRYIYKEKLEAFIKFAVRIWDLDYNFEETERMAMNGIDRLESYFREIGMPVTLKELDKNISEDRFDEIARKSTEKGPIGFFRPLEKDDVLNILRMAKG
jgi:alcohol dehydrogenase YqhD (iron-dependent ADH family)